MLLGAHVGGANFINLTHKFGVREILRGVKILIFIYLFLSGLLIGGLLSFLMIFLGKILSKKRTSDREFQRPFECGFSTFREHRLTFSLHFFIVALVFILFDIELIILFPLIIEVVFKHSLLTQLFFLFFLVLLTLGLLREWNQGALEWA